MSIIIEVECTHCHRTICRDRGRVNENRKLRHNFYCSRECQYSHRIKKIALNCENNKCTREFIRNPGGLSEHNYCSQTCAAHVNNVKFPKRGPGFKICAQAECGQHISWAVKYCSNQCRIKARNRFSPGELITLLQTMAKNLQRSPSKREAIDIADICIRMFGTWNSALKKAGLTPNRSHSQRMYHRMNTRARDGHICDSISEALIDNWLSAHGIAHERDVLYPTTGHKADWAISDHLFIEYFGLVNDSRRYDRAVEIKKELCNKFQIKLIEIYPRDLYPINKIDKKLKILYPPTCLC